MKLTVFLLLTLTGCTLVSGQWNPEYDQQNGYLNYNPNSTNNSNDDRRFIGPEPQYEQDRIEGGFWLYLDPFDMKKFHIKQKCFDRTRPQKLSLGNSIETLIGLIEKFEQHWQVQNKQPERVARLFLRSFRFDGIKWNEFIGSPINDYTINFFPYAEETRTYHQNIFGERPAPTNDYFPSYVYTETEICQLFQLLSHTYITHNATRPRPRNEQQNWESKNNKTSDQSNEVMSSYNSYENQSNKVDDESIRPTFVQEVGVASVKAMKGQAVAPGRVLAGILVSLMNVERVPLETLVGKRITNPNHKQKTVDPLAAATIADLFAKAGQQITSAMPTLPVERFGIAGQWMSRSCARIYDLLNSQKIDENMLNYTIGTMAEIRGGIDGFLIGEAIKRLNPQQQREIRLSSILRRYYSAEGLVIVQNTPRASFCDRQFTLEGNRPDGGMSLIESVNTYYLALVYKTSTKPELETAPLGSANNLISQARQPDVVWQACQISTGGAGDYGASCETPSDVLFVIDNDRTRVNISKTVVSDVSASLNEIARIGGTISVFGSQPGQFAYNSYPDFRDPLGINVDPYVDYGLMPIAFNESSLGCAGCLIEQLSSDKFSPTTDQVLYFKYLNTTLMHYKYWNPRINATARAGITVVLVDAGSLGPAPTNTRARNELKRFLWENRYLHRDVQYIAVSNKQNNFNDLLKPRQDENPNAQRDSQKFWSPSIGQPFMQSNDVVKTICENPAVFRHQQCLESPSTKESSLYVGTITPNKRQSWAMFPEHFYNSSQINFYFKPMNGKIKVCFGRTIKPGNTSDCKEAVSGEEVVYEIDMPCFNQSMESCRPLFFTIWGFDLTQPCNSERCRTFNQVLFHVTHEGVECSSRPPKKDEFTIIREQIEKMNNEYKQKFEKLEKTLNQTRNELTKVQSPVPIGFVYVQLPKQAKPIKLWPNTTWKEMSKDFAGLFFRVDGGNATAFGTVQDDFSPRIVQGKSWWKDQCNTPDKKFLGKTNLLERKSGASQTKWATALETGITKDMNWTCRRVVQFEMQNGEVRPKNTAVKIWKRTA